MEEQRPKRTPLGFSHLLDGALGAFRRRAGLYLLVAVGAFAFQLIAMPFASYEANDAKIIIAILVSSLADSLIAAVVCIGVARDLLDEPTSPIGILSTALERLWAVFIVVVVVQVLQGTLLPAFTSLEGSFYGILIAPAALFYGALQSAVVIASVDPEAQTGLVIVRSIGRSFFLSLSGGNIGRTALIGLIAIAPTLLEFVLIDVLHVRHVANPNFWGNVPVDMLVSGPLAALLTVFYLDVLKRANAAA